MPVENGTISTNPPAVAVDAGELSADNIAAEREQIAAARERIVAAEQLRHSYLGRFGRTIEPAIRPMGFDWRLGVGILSSFLAREVFVGTMGITYSVGEADESSTELRDQLAAATWPDGRRVLTPAAGLSLMVFYVLACQCVSTLAVTRRETGSWRWPMLMFAYMTTLACAAALTFMALANSAGAFSDAHTVRPNSPIAPHTTSVHPLPTIHLLWLPRDSCQRHQQANHSRAGDDERSRRHVLQTMTSGPRRAPGRCLEWRHARRIPGVSCPAQPRMRRARTVTFGTRTRTEIVWTRRSRAGGR